MGARNSTPTTVRIENPERALAVQVTPSVVSRLVGSEDEAQRKSEEYKENQREKHQEDSHNFKQTQDPYQRRYLELEESQFDKSIEKVKSMIGKPLSWEQDFDEIITNLRHDLIKCYQDHPKQALSCADIANQFQHFIFEEQFKTITKFNEKNEKNGKSTENEENEESVKSEESDCNCPQTQNVHM